MDTAERFWTGIGLALVIAVTSTLVAGAVISDGGREAQNHTGPIPSGVVQLTGRDYLIVRDAPLTPSQICHGDGGGQGATPVDTATTVPQLRGDVFVVCDVGQTWNDHRPASINFGTGILHAWRAPLYYILLAGVFAVCLLPALVEGVRVARAERARERKRKVDNELKREQLTQAWAKDQISDEEFERKLGELV